VPAAGAFVLQEGGRMEKQRFHVCAVFACVFSLALLASSSALPLAAQTQSDSLTATTPPDSSLASALLHDAPMMFIENVGQFGKGARFQLRGADRTVWLANDAIWVTVLEPLAASGQPSTNPQNAPAKSPIENRKSEIRNRKGVNLRLSFVGANPQPHLEPFNRLDTHVSYFTGNDPAKWHADVPVWSGVRYKDLYPGIDLEIVGERGQMVQRVIARSGANANTVRLRVDGAERIALDGDRLRVSTVAGEYTLPLLQVTGASVANLARPAISGNQVAAPFARSAIATPQATRDSPSHLAYGTYLAGSNEDEGWGIAVDASGAAYVTGWTYSTDFPTTSGAFTMSNQGFADVFVAKLNAGGTWLHYATFLGGSNRDYGYGIAIDGSGAAYVTGYTESADFPTTYGAFWRIPNGGYDVFVAKLNTTGTSLHYSTFLGGSSDEYGKAIAVDGSGAAYVTGYTDSPNFPTTPGALDETLSGTDAFVVKLTASGASLHYSTFLGGNSSDNGYGIALDSSGAAYITGYTQSYNFPTTLGAFDTTNNDPDAFVVKLNTTGTALHYGTFLGGTYSETGYGIAVDASGAAFVTGWTFSLDFPWTSGSFDTTHNGAYDVFVTKLNAAGTGLIYSTYLGGSATDIANSIAVDSSGAAYVTGWTGSSNFPITPGAFRTSCNGCDNYQNDAFLVKLNATGTAPLDYGTFFGGGLGEFGNSIAIDTNGAAYITGYTYSTDFPTTPDAFDPTFNGEFEDGYVIKLAFTRNIAPVFPTSHTTPSTVMQGGTAYRHFRLIDGNGNPIAGATVALSAGNPATTDANGYFTASIPTSALGGIGSYQVSVQSVTYGGQTYTTNNQPTFTIQVTERRYSNAWSYGASTRAKGGVSAGFIAYLQRTTSGGLEIKLDESNPDITSDDVVLMREDFSDEIGAGGGAGMEKGATISILQVKGGGEATAEFYLRTMGSTETRFPNPYSDNDRKGEGVFLLASTVDSIGQSWPGKPFVASFLKLALDRAAPYSNYVSQQQAGIGAKITPLQLNVGVKGLLGINRSGSLWKDSEIGFDLADVGVSVVQMSTLTDYRSNNEWGLGYESEHSVDWALLSPTAEIGQFKSKMSLFFNNQPAKKVQVELIFDSTTNALKRLELGFSGDGNTSLFGTIEEATAKVSIPASQLGSDRLSRTVNILRLLQAAQETSAAPLQIGSSAMINELNSLLSGLGYADYEFIIDDGTETRLETELGITAIVKIELGPGLSVKKVRRLVRERGVFTNGQFYQTESYAADALVSRAGKSWTDLTVNALSGLWLLVRDAFYSVSQQVSATTGWVLSAISRTATGILYGGAQLNVPAGSQMQQIVVRGAQLRPTQSITVTATGWVPTSGATSMPRRLRTDLAVASGADFAVGGVYEFQPSTLMISPAATLVITYTNEAAAGKDKNRIGMFCWNADANNWQSVAGQTPEPANNKVTASINQLGTYTLGYDITAPQISILAPTNGSTVANLLPPISALITDTGVGINAATVQMQLDGQIVASTFVTSTGQLVYMPTAPLTLGSHTTSISAQDVAGNSASASATFTVEPPYRIRLPIILR
jgi:hypothetical protein